MKRKYLSAKILHKLIWGVLALTTSYSGAKLTVQDTNYFDALFKNQLNNVSQAFNSFNNYAQGISKKIEYFSRQPVEFHQHYEHVMHLLSLVDGIDQKQLTIALVKLLQYKLYVSQATLALSDDLIKKINDSVSILEVSLTRIPDLHVEWNTAHLINGPAEYKNTSLIDLYQEIILNRLFFRLKKIKRVLSDWRKTIVSA